jgi:hypothetical protein
MAQIFVTIAMCVIVELILASVRTRLQIGERANAYIF